MGKQLQQRWYTKKRYLIPVWVLLSLGLIFGSFNGSSVLAKTTKLTHPTSSYSVLSNNHYYTNSKRNSVHSPAYSTSIPVGASAQCGDGTYSFSQSHRGTCSHHGGVGKWE